MNIALERTLKLKFKTMGSSSPSILTKKILFCPAIGGGAWAPLSTPVVVTRFPFGSFHVGGGGGGAAVVTATGHSRRHDAVLYEEQA